MKRVLIVVVLVIAAAALGLIRSSGGIRQGLARAAGISNESQPGGVSEEIRKSFQLQPGAHLEVKDINGAVTIETSDTKTAEVYVLRTAGSKDALNRREIIIEQTDDGLLIRGRTSHSLGFWEHLFGKNPHEEVTIKAPRAIVLALKGINGHVTSGDVAGAIEAKGINGRVDLAQAGDSVEIGGINGNVSVGLKQLSDRGAKVSGVNGNIELRLASGLNADLIAKGMNGSLSSSISEVTVDKQDHGSGYSARIGSGGAQITISGINGNVRLMRAGGSDMTAAPAEKKSTAPSQKSEKMTESKNVQ